MPSRPVRQNTEAELEAFDRVCESLSGFDGGLSFELVDGFLAGLAAAPRVPEPEVWLPVVFEDNFDRAFGDPAARAQALTALQARLRVLCDQLDPEALLDDPDQLRLDPLIAEYTDEHRQRLVDEEGMSPEDATIYQTGVWWAEGFFECVGKMPALWELPPGDEAQAVFDQAFDQINALRLAPFEDRWKTHLDTYYPKGAPTREELLAEACMAVQDLRLFWVDFAPKTETRRVEATPGRNDPCPCGSGKKYKKCHGLAA
jgi:uncharacterized protein